MKRFFSLLLALVMLTCTAACGAVQTENHLEPAGAEQEAMTPPIITEAPPEEAVQEEDNMTMNIQIGENVLTATLVQNSSTEALLEMLADGPVTVEMDDYNHMEKVGTLPESLPRNDESINTSAGDLILYQGNSFVIYYDTNSWSLTRLGKLDNVTQQELMNILGSESVTAVLSLPEK